MQKSPFKIVIAEDNSADVMLVREALKAHRIDCTIQVLCDGEQALKFLEESDGQMDLLLLDLHLPKFDGCEVLKRLRDLSRYADTPVIVMTTLDAGAPEMLRVREMASVCFPKASSLDEFLKLGAIVRELLENRRASSPPDRDAVGRA